MTGAEGGSLTTTLKLPGNGEARLLVRFLLFITDYHHSQGQHFFSSGHDITMELWETDNDTVHYSVSDLSRLQPSNSLWTEYQVEVIVTRGLSYQLEILMIRGSVGVIAIDNISLEYKPVLATAEISLPSFLPLTENHTESQNVSTSAPTTTSTTIVTPTTPPATTEIIQPNASLSTAEPVVTTTNISTPTSLPANLTEANKTESMTEQSAAKPVLDPQDKKDDSMYGYKGEVVLICFTVLFIVLFALMMVKYHRLKTRFGGYEVEPQGGGRNNPGYDLQMSYRNGDE